MLDSGATFDIVRRSSLTPLEMETLRIAPHSHCLDTASEQLQANEVITTQAHALKERAHPHVLDSSLELLSMGHRCRWEGNAFRWEALSDKPTLTNPDGHFVELVNIANIPYVMEPIAESGAKA